MYTALCSSLLFPLHERLKGHHSVSMHRELEASQWWPAERLLAAQAQRLREFLLQVGRDVPYYRDLFARTGFDPATVQSVADLQGLAVPRQADDPRQPVTGSSRSGPAS